MAVTKWEMKENFEDFIIERKDYYSIRIETGVFLP